MVNNISLKQFVRQYGTKTDKYDLGYIDGFYDKLFTPIQNEVKHVLEVGIHHGYSLELWQSFFNYATIVGVDINHCPEIQRRERIVQYTEDAYSHNSLNKFKESSFDIIIDDGPHTYNSMVFFLQNYLKLVKPGGYLILEDIINTSWTKDLKALIPDNLKVTVYNMAGKQRNRYLLELWQNGLDVIVVENSVIKI